MKVTGEVASAHSVRNSEQNEAPRSVLLFYRGVHWTPAPLADNIDNVRQVLFSNT